MSFNLNSPWGEANVAALLASVTDDRNWRLIVDRAGLVSLLDATNNPTPLNALHCYFETYVRGNGYVGPAAAADAQFVHEIAEDLRANWPNLVDDAYIDH